MSRLDHHLSHNHLRSEAGGGAAYVCVSATAGGGLHMCVSVTAKDDETQTYEKRNNRTVCIGHGLTRRATPDPEP
jgi:formiminotetrahydrofolate cyclodeaminase